MAAYRTDEPTERGGRHALPDQPMGAQFHPRFARQQGEGLATALGLFSIGLGLAQLAAPDAVTRLVGGHPTDRSRTTMRGLGIREFSNGMAILAQPRASGWLWSRVAGDAMDLTLLSRLLADDRNNRSRTLTATAAVLGVAALDYVAARQLGLSAKVRPPVNQAGPARDAGIAASSARRVSRSVTVNRPREEVYAFWRNFENLPQFMEHLESVVVHSATHSHWTAKAPAGRTVEWEAEIIEDVPNERIVWRSLENASIRNAGAVRFLDAPGDRGTELHVELEYQPPAGMLGATVAMLFQEEPKQQVRDDLRAFKQVMEVGEVLRSDASRSRGPHPARPTQEHVA